MEVVAHSLTLAEHEVNEPTVESLDTAIALLRAVVATHGAILPDPLKARKLDSDSLITIDKIRMSERFYL